MKHNAWKWAKLKGIKIYDADGWRGARGRPMEDEISEEEFDERVKICTISLLTHRLPDA